MQRITRSRLPASAAADTAQHEMRREQRLCTLFKTGRLLSTGPETICRVRNISSNGFMADVCPAPPPGEMVTLELSEGSIHEARVVWSHADRFGAEFLVPQSVSRLLGSGADRDPRRRHRALRLEPRGASVTILHQGPPTRASILNISQTGMAVFACGLSLSAGASRALRIDVDGLDPMDGFLCWNARDEAGIQFQVPLSFETLSHWLWATALAVNSHHPLSGG